MEPERMETMVCIAGGGPAGMMLGLLLARAGVDVVVLEKHQDFFRDFRGDTIHPSTVEILEQLGLLDRLKRIEHTSLPTLDAVIKGVRFTAVDFRSRRHRTQHLMFMPQWDLLALLAEAASELPNFRLLMDAEATTLLRYDTHVRGVRARVAGRRTDVLADLTIAADGRTSGLRRSAGLVAHAHGVPIDVLWFRVPRPSGENPPDTIAYVTDTDVVITIPRTDYYQTALLIQKGAFDAVRERGLDAFRRTVLAATPFLEPTIDAVSGWDDVKLLSVQVDRLPRWHRPGFLAIGDAAHAMSPAFGVGINYAVQDAVAAANLLVRPLLDHDLTEADLAAVQHRREAPVRQMQAIQLRLHAVVGKPGGGANLPSAGIVRTLAAPASAVGRRAFGRLIGWGFRPEKPDEAMWPWGDTGAASLR
ncbi:FAD-dependent oxidoreductase [Plantibacter sp. Mn2098]|uniref:FAD-dependent oxidoreductase n=1 Tax=Plantibacter sp. Mn2098 TaxID=3395266 RepID=UPI003BECC122